MADETTEQLDRDLGIDTSDGDVPDRALPDAQRPDGEVGESEMITMERAEQMSEYFGDIQAATIDDNRMRAPVADIDWSPNNEAVVVEVDVPAETDAVRFHLDKPKVWTDRYQLVRWVRHYGYGAEDFHAMVEKRVTVEIRETGLDDYELVVPERDRSRRDRVRAVAAGVKAAGVADHAAIVTAWLVMGANIAVVTGLLPGSVPLGWRFVAGLAAAIWVLLTVTFSAAVVHDVLEPTD